MKNNTINLAILAILIIQLTVLFAVDYRITKLEQKINEYFAPIEDVELPKWEEQ